MYTLFFHRLGRKNDWCMQRIPTSYQFSYTKNWSVFLHKERKLHTTHSWNFLALQSEDVIIGNMDTGTSEIHLEKNLLYFKKYIHFSQIQLYFNINYNIIVFRHMWMYLFKILIL